MDPPAGSTLVAPDCLGELLYLAGVGGTALALGVLAFRRLGRDLAVVL